jgi:hypothetical protein
MVFRHESCIRRGLRHEPVLIGCRIPPDPLSLLPVWNPGWGNSLKEWGLAIGGKLGCPSPKLYPGPKTGGLTQSCIAPRLEE